MEEKGRRENDSKRANLEDHVVKIVCLTLTCNQRASGRRVGSNNRRRWEREGGYRGGERERK